jgi:hypothetical protein
MKKLHTNITKEALQSVEAIEARTETYTPVPHAQFVDLVEDTADEILGEGGFEPHGSQYVISGDTGRFFMVHTYKGDYENGIGAPALAKHGLRLQIAAANSTDKSLVGKVAIGAQVSICTNGMVSGDLCVFRKHTGDIVGYILAELKAALWQVTGSWELLQDDVTRMQGFDLTDTHANFLIGDLWAQGLVPIKKLAAIKDHWLTNTDFPGKNMWSLYNAVTEQYKGLPPAKVLPAFMGLHEWAKAGIDTGNFLFFDPEDPA